MVLNSSALSDSPKEEIPTLEVVKKTVPLSIKLTEQMTPNKIQEPMQLPITKREEISQETKQTMTTLTNSPKNVAPCANKSNLLNTKNTKRTRDVNQQGKIPIDNSLGAVMLIF